MIGKLEIAALALCGVFACTQAPPAPAPAPVAAAPAHTGHQAAAALDTRTPLPLLPIMAEHQKEQMRGHLVAVQQILAALTKDDFAAVEAATRKIGYSEPMAQMCTHMGAGASGFTPMALNFHRTADTIGEAARKKDRTAVLAALSATLGTCTSCHATYKQQVVDEATWAKLGATATEMGGHGMRH